MNACTHFVRLAARNQSVRPLSAASRPSLPIISARSIGLTPRRPGRVPGALSRSFTTIGLCGNVPSQPMPELVGSLRKLWTQRFFTGNASMNGPRFFSTNATLSGEGVAAGDAAAPKVAPRSVGWWLLGTAGLVYAVVIVGGLTRLTESGLSITEWKPITGVLPPLTWEEWDQEFDKYKASPEFAQLNSNFNLDDFKKIFYMEWGHRMLGRLIGIAVIVPYAYYMLRKRLPRPLSHMGASWILLVGAQGAMGWYMVKSGLHEDLFAEGATPRVSQYRLAAHLGLAFALYAGMFHAGLRVLWDNKYVSTGRFAGWSAEQATRGIGALRGAGISAYRRNIWILSGMVLLTAISGAFVAGLDAGLVYNEFPTMGTGFTPPMSELFDKAYAKRADGMDMWRNLFENPSTVQLNHRILAVSTYLATCAAYFSSFRPAVRAALPPLAARLSATLFVVVHAQVFLGISTLLYLVPTHLAATHQAGSVALLTTVLALGMTLRAPGKAAQLLRQNPLLRKVPPRT